VTPAANFIRFLNARWRNPLGCPPTHQQFFTVLADTPGIASRVYEASVSIRHNEERSSSRSLPCGRLNAQKRNRLAPGAT